MLSAFRVQNNEFQVITVLTTSIDRAIKLSGFRADEVRSARKECDVDVVDGVLAADVMSVDNAVVVRTSN